MSNNSTTQPIVKIGLFIVSPCSFFTLGSIQEPFIQANKVIGENKYQFVFVADRDDKQIELKNGVNINAEYSIDDSISLDILMVISEIQPTKKIDIRIKRFLQRAGCQPELMLIGVDMGAFWLAESGLIRDQPVTVHWQSLDQLSDIYHDLHVTPHLFETSQQRMSCAGKAINLDFMLYLIEKYEDNEVSAQVAEYLCIDRMRLPDERQRIPLHNLGGETQPKLTLAMELMEQNMEEPLATEEIAELVNLSRRQLERLFKRYVGNMPAKYYLELRLKRARQLLLTSSQSIIQIGLSCGFSSGPHFSSAYKSFFNLTPRDERNNKLKAS
jgi:Transcriptional regulator containing an amidase domain and an AraC-type DNA-binding HTH domain